MKNVEIERKFLVRKEDIGFELKKYRYENITQGYLYLRPSIRIRKANNKYFFTIKTKPPKEINVKNDLARTEYEIEISKKCYNYLLKYHIGRLITKRRYFIEYKGYTIELDIFSGDLKGLIYAEIEFNSVEKALKFSPPKWFYKDVTGIEKYKNTQLSICKNLKNVIEY